MSSGKLNTVKNGKGDADRVSKHRDYWNNYGDIKFPSDSKAKGKKKDATKKDTDSKR